MRKVKAHASMMDVHNGLITHWERRGNHGIDAYAKEGASYHRVPQEDFDQMAAFALIAKQAARWAAEAHVASERLRTPSEHRKRKQPLTRRRAAMRRKVRVMDGRLPDELPPTQLRLPPAHAKYVEPMELFQHTLQVAGVVR